MNSIISTSFFVVTLTTIGPLITAYSLFPIDICFSEVCYERGMEINKSLHFSPIDPCDNFYKFSCNGWISHAERPPFEVLWNHWNEVAHKINAKLRRILEDRLPATETLRKAKFMYLVCLDSKRNYLDELLLFSRAMGGWPLAGERKTPDVYEWAKKVAEITRFGSSSPLLRLFVDVDYKNTSKYTMYIQPGDLVMPSYILQQAEVHVEQLLRYKRWIADTVRYMYPKRSLPKLNDDIDDMITLEIKLAKLSANNSGKRTMKLRDLNAKTNMDWSDVFRVLLNGSGVQVELDDYVVVSYYSYLLRLVQLARKTSPNIFANYVTWHIIQELSRDTSAHLRYLNFQINSAIFGIEQDYPTEYECAAKVAKYFNFALAAKYAESYTVRESADYVATMTTEIKNEFLTILRQNRWFSKQGLRGVIQTIENASVVVGFPTWVRNASAVEMFYKDIQITNNHFLNVLHLRKNLARKNFQKLLLTDVDIKWPQNLFDINGYYNQLQNTIIISLGLLEKPFFSPDSPSVLNYGALGSLIGHELVHALDTLGGHAGNSNIKGWTGLDAKKYKNKIACLKLQYDNYNVNGQQTITENIADNVGIELSFRAYRRTTKAGRNVQIPFLEKYTQDQMFFISYAQMWCELHGNEDFSSEGEHAPVQYRVQGVVSNSGYFHKSYACVGVDNDRRKCRLW